MSDINLLYSFHDDYRSGPTINYKWEDIDEEDSNEYTEIKTFSIPESGVDIYITGYGDSGPWFFDNVDYDEDLEDLAAEFSMAFYGIVGFKCTGHTSSYTEEGGYGGNVPVRASIKEFADKIREEKDLEKYIVFVAI